MNVEDALGCSCSARILLFVIVECRRKVSPVSFSLYGLVDYQLLVDTVDV